MTAKTIAHWTLNLILRKRIASRIRNTQNSRISAPRQMFPHWFSLHRSHRDRPKWFWWWSMQSQRGGTREGRQSRTECVNVSPASLCILTESFSWWYSIGEWWPVACESWLIKRCITGAMNFLTWYIKFSPVRANSATISLCSALPQGPVSIG